MKSLTMKQPVLSELYSQKLIHSAHLKKLQNINRQRKTQLGFDKARSTLIDNLKQQKAMTFANNFNREHQYITEDNLRVIKKLETVQPASSITQHKAATLRMDKWNRSNSKTKSQQSFSIDNSSWHKNGTKIVVRSGRINSIEARLKQEDKDKENNRLYAKLKSISSSLNHKKLREDHQKSEKVKQRLMRYSRVETENANYVQLKSEKFINRNLTSKSTYLSPFSNTKNKNIREIVSQNVQSVKNTSKSSHSISIPSNKNKQQSNLTYHYKRDDIMKNRIENIERYKATHVGNVIRPAKSTINNEQDSDDRQRPNQGFFATQITRKPMSSNLLSKKVEPKFSNLKKKKTVELEMQEKRQLRYKVVEQKKEESRKKGPTIRFINPLNKVVK